MGFQLVKASDNEIVVWHTEHGHIYIFEIPPEGSELTARWHKDIPDAACDAESLKAEALTYATEQARTRQYLK